MQRIISRTLHVGIMLAVVAALVLFEGSRPVVAQTTAPVTMSCATNGSSGDNITRGFYVTNFPGDTLYTVSIRYYPGDVTTATLQLTIRSGAFNGPVVGTATVTADFSVIQNVTYNFGGVPVSGTLTFEQSIVSGTGTTLFYDTGNGPLGVSAGTCPGFTETEDTAPPLSTFRRSSIGVTLTGTSGGCGRLPDGSIMGKLNADTQAYYEPGNIAPGVVVKAGTYWVIGVDKSQKYYKIMLSCQFLWLPIQSLAPSYEAPWSGQPLPTRIVD